MKTRRILNTVIVICVLFAVCGVDQTNMDAFQAERRIEDKAAKPVPEDDESLETAELTEADAESGRGAELTEADAEDDQDTEQAAALDGYAAFLEEYEPQRTDERGLQFALFYLDDDDVPELALTEGWAHGQGAFVYRFQDGEVVLLGEYGEWGEMSYREKEGLIMDNYATQGNYHNWVYQLEENQAVVLQSYDMCSEGIMGEEFTYWVDEKEVSEEQYREVLEKWSTDGCKSIRYSDCRMLPRTNIREALQEELESLTLTLEEVLKQNMLLKAEAQESDILLFDYDDYDDDGNYEAFMLVGDRMDSEYDWVSGGVYEGRLYFASADCCELVRDNDYGYRMIDGKMEFSSGRKYLFFDTDQYTTANVSELWTVRDGEPVEESGLLQTGEVSYRGGDEFEVWVDAYDLENDIDVELDLDIWLGHTWKPYFYHYNTESDQLEAYGGEIISREAFTELSETNIIEEIEAKGYTVGEIIHWENDIVTINYHYDTFESCFYYENVIWDNNVKDFWRKAERDVTSWEDAGVGGIYLCGSMRK